jgi:hypothetical protein
MLRTFLVSFYDWVCAVDGVLLVELGVVCVCPVDDVSLVELCVEDVLDAALAALVASVASVSVSPRMAITCSSSLNWASCETNVVLSVGFSGSWFCSCATSNCRNICSVGAGMPLVNDDDADDAPAEADDAVIGLTADAISCSLRLFAPGNATFQFLDPSGPLRVALSPPVLLLLRTAGVRLRIVFLRAAGAAAGLEDGTGLYHRSSGAPRLGAGSVFLEAAYQVG